jgi:predicted Rdx family selenoprotein
LGLDTVLVKGDRGMFEVSVENTVVAQKTFGGFPTEDEVVEAVRRALSA